MILAGDVGGTKTLLGLFRRRNGRLLASRVREYDSQAAGSVVEPIRSFLDDGPERPRACALGVAGPVDGGRAARVNLPWAVDGSRVRRALGFDRVEVVNDAVATAWGIRELPPGKLRSLTPRARSRTGPAALLAAGTGLGAAILFHDGRRLVPGSSEGGHATWAPPDREALDLWRWLADVHDRVELEHVVSGRGLGAIFDRLVDRGARPPARVRRALERADDRNAEISRLALAGEDPAADEALDRFVRYFGAAAGDVALLVGAVGGVYLGGGIAPKILPRLQSGGFVDAFRDKGALSSFVTRIPIRVILDPRCALIGAASRGLACVTGASDAAGARTRRRRRPNHREPKR